LSKWIDSMLTNLSLKKDLSLDLIFENLQIIYTGCLQELIRQISIQCVERGQLMQKIWNAYISLFERIIIEQKKFSNDIEKNYLMETSRIHKVYQNEIDFYKNKLELEKNENDQNKKSYSVLLEKYKQLKIKNKKMVHDFSTHKVNFDNMRAEFNIIQEENINLKITLEKFANTKETDKSDVLIRKLPVRKIGSFVEKNLNENQNTMNSININEKERLEEESFDISLEDKCVDTYDLLLLNNRNAFTQTGDLIQNNMTETDILLQKIDNINVPIEETHSIGIQTDEGIEIENRSKKVSIFVKKKQKIDTEIEIDDKNPSLLKKNTMQTDMKINFQKFLTDIDMELGSEENGIRKNIKFIDMLNEKCIGSLIADDFTSSPLRNHLKEFKNNIKKTTNSLHERVNSIIEENQDQKIDILEKDNDIENKDEEIRRKNEEITYLKENVNFFLEKSKLTSLLESKIGGIYRQLTKR